MTKQPVKWVACILLFLASGFVLAAEWELVYEDAGYREEIDRDSLHRTGQTAQVWDRLTPPGGAAADSEGFNYRYVLTWSDYDCASKRITAKRRIYIGDNVRQVKEQRPIHQPVVETKPGTPRAILLSVVCGVSPSGAAVATVGSQTAAVAGQSTKAAVAGNAGQPQLLPNRRKAELSVKSAPAASASSDQAVATGTADAKAAKAPSSAKSGAVSGQKQTTANPAASAGKTTNSKSGDGTCRYLKNQLQGGKSGEIILTTSGMSATTSKVSPSSKSE